MSHHSFQTAGTCSKTIEFDIDNLGRLKNVKFIGGCHGNTQGLSALAEGLDANEAIKRLSGIDCRGKGTSCPDQLAKAIQKALKN